MKMRVLAGLQGRENTRTRDLHMNCKLGTLTNQGMCADCMMEVPGRWIIECAMKTNNVRTVRISGRILIA
jgi:hypothetical protein